LIAATVSFVAPVENDSSRITASIVPGAIAQVTSGMSSCARTMVRSRLEPSASWRPSVTDVPAGPRTLATTWSIVSPATEAPSTRTMDSPARSPAFSAGLPGMTRTTVATLFCMSSTAPTPTNVPDSDWSRAATSSAVR
jgi:hypothetical protein